MQPPILEYLSKQRVGVLAIEMPDGSPHAATVHFAHAENPIVFYFETYREYRKSEALFAREISRASFVVGVSETEMQTLQIDGEVRIIHADEKAAYDEVYFGKFPEKKAKSMDPKFVFFQFVPKSWRFTDFTGPGGKLVLVSE